jgi:Phasin protein
MASDTDAERAAKQAEQVVEQTMDQTRGALENYFSFMQKAFAVYPVGGTELAEKMNRYTAQNISAARDFVHKLSQAKDFQEIIHIQTEFMQTQFSVLAEQTKGLTEASTTGATGTKPSRNWWLLNWWG